MIKTFLRFQKGASRQLDQIWLVMELCDGGSVAELVQGLKKACIVGYLKEIEIAYILRWFSVGISLITQPMLQQRPNRIELR